MKLYCRTYSSGNQEELNQPPIIFLHGMGLNGITYKKVAPVISERTKRKIYVPDIRNHGKSPWVKEMTYDVLTNDVLELMEQNNIQKAILIGSSMGGRIAMNFALKYPHKVEAIVVEDMTPRNIMSSGNNVVRLVHSMIEDILNTFSPDVSLNEVKTNVRDLLLSLPTIMNQEKMKRNYDPDFFPIVKDGNRFRLECNIDVLLTMLDGDALVQNLPDLNVTFDGPALFLYGTRGFFKLGKDPSIKKLFPRAIIVKVEDASHIIYFDSPEEFTNIVSDFILHKDIPQSKY